MALNRLKIRVLTYLEFIKKIIEKTIWSSNRIRKLNLKSVLKTADTQLAVDR